MHDPDRSRFTSVCAPCTQKKCLHYKSIPGTWLEIFAALQRLISLAGSNLWGQNSYPPIDGKGRPAPTINVTAQGGQGYGWQGRGNARGRGRGGGSWRGRGNYGNGGYNGGNYGGGSFYNRGRGYGRDRQQDQNTAPSVTVPREDFDFTVNLAKFNKDDLIKVSQVFSADWKREWC